MSMTATVHPVVLLRKYLRHLELQAPTLAVEKLVEWRTAR
jgi:hypothetical protein